MNKCKMIGYCYVVGDILHRGHLLHLKNCKALCDILFCGVLSEKAVTEKKSKPILALAERLEIVGSIKYVDVALCQDTYSPLENCKAIKPEILFESSSHKEMPANNFMKSIGGRVIVMPYFVGQSSTKIKAEVKNDEPTKTSTGDSKPDTVNT